MWTDPIVDEVRREREAHGELLGFDVAAICRDLQRLQKQEIDGKLVPPPQTSQQQKPPAA